MKKRYLFGVLGSKNKYTIKAAMAVPELKKIAEMNKDITIKAWKNGTNGATEFATNTIYVGLGLGKKAALSIAMHELGHIRTRLKAVLIIEKAAWAYAKVYADKNGIKFDEKFMNECLNTYKEALGLK